MNNSLFTRLPALGSARNYEEEIRETDYGIIFGQCLFKLRAAFIFFDVMEVGASRPYATSLEVRVGQRFLKTVEADDSCVLENIFLYFLVKTEMNLNFTPIVSPTLTG